MKDFVVIDFETANGRRSSVCADNATYSRTALGAYTRPFDESCLKAVFNEYGMEYLDYEFHCTLAASRRNMKLPCHQLHVMTEACGYDL